MDEQEIVRNAKRRLGGLREIRNRYESVWKDVRDYFLPEHGRFEGEQADDGAKKDSKVLDTTPAQALETMAAGMQSGLTSPARPWFRLSTDNPELADIQSVKEWLYFCEERVYALISRIGLYNVFHHTYLELGFGTAAFGIYEGPYEDPIFCEQYTIGEYFLGTNSRGKVNCFARQFRMTAAQIFEKFGEDKVSANVKSAANNPSAADKKFDVVQLIEPNQPDESMPGLKKFAFRCVYYEPGEDKALKISGFYEFPVCGPRWHVVANDVYGFGRGKACLSDTKMLMKLQVNLLEGMDKVNRPPVVDPGETDIDDLPGGITHARGGMEQLKPLYQIQPQLQYTQQTIQSVEARISRGFYADLFLMLTNDDKSGRTATEIAERHEEKLTILGPVLERLHTELLSPCIQRMFNMAMRIGYLPPPPREMLQGGGQIKIQYISLLDQAQKLVGLTAMEQYLNFAGALAKVKPEALDKIDGDEMLDDYGDACGIPPTCIKSDEEVAAIRQQRSQQMAQQQQAAAVQAGAATAAQGAQAAKTISDIPTDNPTLQMMLGNMLQR